MALTISDVIFRARGHLNDQAVPYRYTENDVMALINDAILEAKRNRPDFFVGRQEDNVLVTASTDAFPLPDFTMSITALFVAGMCEVRDDEHADTQRANALITKYISALKTAMT